MGPLLAPIEAAIHDKLIPALLGGMPDRPSREDFRCLIANSVRFGGLAIRQPHGSFVCTIRSVSPL